VKRNASASSKTSPARGGSGAGGAASAASGRLPHAAGAAQVARPHRGHECFQVRLAGQAGVERVEQPGRAEQEPGCGGAALLVKGDQPAQALHLCGAQRVRRSGPGRDQQRQSRIEGTRVMLGLRRGQRPPGPSRRIRRQRRGPLQERRRGGQAAACLRPPGRALQLRGDTLIRPGGGLRPVPGAAVRIDRRIGGLGQGPVNLLFLPSRRRPVSGRARQRMPEQHPAAELGQARVGRGPRRFGADPQPPSRPPDQRQIPGRLGRGQ
jgi:hypothetical protein